MCTLHWDLAEVRWTFLTSITTVWRGRSPLLSRLSLQIDGWSVSQLAKSSLTEIKCAWSGYLPKFVDIFDCRIIAGLHCRRVAFLLCCSSELFPRVPFPITQRQSESCVLRFEMTIDKYVLKSNTIYKRKTCFPSNLTLISRINRPTRQISWYSLETTRTLLRVSSGEYN